MFFTRVVEMDDTILPSNRSHAGDTDDGYESDEADVHGLVRVTVIARRKRIKIIHAPDSWGASALAGSAEPIDNKPTSSRSKDIRYYPQGYTHSTPGLGRRGSVNGSIRPGVNYYSSGYPYRSDEPSIPRRWGAGPGTYYTDVRGAVSRNGRDIVIINHSLTRPGRLPRARVKVTNTARNNRS